MSFDTDHWALPLNHRCFCECEFWWVTSFFWLKQSYKSLSSFSLFGFFCCDIKNLNKASCLFITVHQTDEQLSNRRETTQQQRARPSPPSSA